MTTETQAPANGQVERSPVVIKFDGFVIVDGQKYVLPRPPRIMGRPDAKELRLAMKAPKLPQRVAAMKKLSSAICEPEVETQMLAHLEDIVQD